MTFASAPTSQYGFAFGDGTGNQWLFGGAGQGVQVLQVDGLEGLPNLRTQDSGRGYADGGFSGRDFLDSRAITFTLQIMNDANNSMQYYLQELQRYLMPQRSGLNVLQVYLPGGRGVRRIYGRVRRRQITVDPQYVYGRAIAQLEFFCPDPRFYNDTLTTYTLNSATNLTRSYNRVYGFSTTSNVTGTGSKTFTVSAGLSYPAGQTITAQSQGTPSATMTGTVTSYSGTSLVTSMTSFTGTGTYSDWALISPFYPITGSGGSGVISVINNGNYETWPSLTITASSVATGVVVWNYTTSQFLSFPGLVLGTNDTLVIDTDLRTVLFNSAPARNLLSNDSRWFALPPNVSQNVGVQALTGTVNCQMTYRDAFI